MSQTNSTNPCFGGLNCDVGYIGFYKDYFADADKLICVKGSPGCGKSTLMRRVADAAVAKGERVRLIFCGSDPSSLDGIYLPERGIGMLDGTAPHPHEPSLPLVDGEILNLGQCLSRRALDEKRELILSCSKEKKEGYASVTRLLGAMRAIRLEMRARYLPLLDNEKMEKAASRAVAALHGEEGEGSVMQLRAFGMSGMAALPLPPETKVIGVRDRIGGGRFYLSALARYSAEKGIRHLISYHPIYHDEIETLLFPDSALAYTTAVSEIDAARYVHMRRFLPRDAEGKGAQWRELVRMEEALLAEAASRFERIRKTHFALEHIYGGAMDFAMANAIGDSVMETVFG